MFVEYIDQVKKKFIEQYGFKENPDKLGVPMDVPDGEYPMVIEGNLDKVKIVDGKIHCLNLDYSWKDLDKVKSLSSCLNSLLQSPEPGLVTWHEAAGNFMKELYKELEKVLNK